MIFSSFFIYQLLKKGFKFSTLRKIRSCIGNLDRNKLIEYKEKNDFLCNDSLIIRTPFNRNIPNLKKILINSCNHCKNQEKNLLSRIKLNYISNLSFN